MLNDCSAEHEVTVSVQSFCNSSLIFGKKEQHEVERMTEMLKSLITMVIIFPSPLQVPHVDLTLKAIRTGRSLLYILPTSTILLVASANDFITRTEGTKSNPVTTMLMATTILVHIHILT